MAITKTLTTVYTTSLTAGAGNVNSTEVDLSSVDSAVVDIKLTNGGTGPTVPAQAQIQLSGDAGTTWFNFGGPLIGSVTASAVAQWAGIQIPQAAKRVRIVLGSNTAQAVTPRVDVTTYLKT